MCGTGGSSTTSFNWPYSVAIRQSDHVVFVADTRNDRVKAYNASTRAVIDVFGSHNAAVREAIAAERLLVFDVEQGWGPLCEFLGVPVPDMAFPALNDRHGYSRNGRRFGHQPLRRSAPTSRGAGR